VDEALRPRQAEERRHAEADDPGDIRTAQRLDQRPDLKQLIKERYLYREGNDVAKARPPLEPPYIPSGLKNDCMS
jgi:hypothetical protein